MSKVDAVLVAPVLTGFGDRLALEPANGALVKNYSRRDLNEDVRRDFIRGSNVGQDSSEAVQA